MRKLLTLLLIIALYANAFSQFVSTTRINTDIDKIYNKQTGKLLTDSELIEILNKSPQVGFDQIINKYGEIDYYEYDPYKKGQGSNKDASRRSKNGDPFPPFVMTSIGNKTLDSEKLIGKNILLQFQLDFNIPFFSPQTLLDANTLINELQNEVEVSSIVVTSGSKEDILKEIDPASYKTEFVSDAQNFSLKYIIIDYPSFILIDKNGNLVSYYDYDELDKIKSDLLNIK